MDTRGIMRPENVGKLFTLERTPPPDDLAALVDRHWFVRWNLGDGPAFRSEVLSHPAVHVAFEPHGAFVYGVRRTRDVRIPAGEGFAAGTKFLPGGFAPFAGGPVSRLTDSVLTLADVFGDDGAQVEREAASTDDLDAKVALLHELLRERATAPDDDALLVRAAVAEMRDAAPGTKVDDVAAHHAVSTRTLQRLFARYVGVGPKWVLQRYRLHTALEQLEAGARADWTRLALDLGYFDHAHFIRDFRAVTGRSPSQYEQETAQTAVAA